jgi:hypothetical protein
MLSAPSRAPFENALYTSGKRRRMSEGKEAGGRKRKEGRRREKAKAEGGKRTPEGSLSPRGAR